MQIRGNMSLTLRRYLEINLSLFKHDAEIYSRLNAVIDFCGILFVKLPESLEAILSLRE